MGERIVPLLDRLCWLPMYRGADRPCLIRIRAHYHDENGRAVWRPIEGIAFSRPRKIRS